MAQTDPETAVSAPPVGAGLTRRHAALAATGVLALGSRFARADAGPLLVGQVGPFTVLPTPDASQVRDGLLASFAEANRAGGVRGRRIELFTLDDAFDPRRFLGQFQAAVARRPVAMMLPIGSAAVGGLLASGSLDAADTVVVGAIPGAEGFRQPGHPRLFHVCAGDRAQIERIVTHCRTLGIRHLRMLAQSIAVGLDGVALMTAAAQAAGGLAVSSTTIAHEPAALEAASAQLVRDAPEAVLLVGTPRFMADALGRVRAAGGRQAAFALSYLSTPLAVAAAGEAGARGLGITQIVPNPNGQDLALQRSFRAAMRHAMPREQAWTPFHLEGYLSARVLLDGLRAIDGPATPAALAHALHALGEIDVDGFRVDFRRGNNGSAWTDIGVISADGRLLY